MKAMPMLTAATTSTMAKPSITLARNRKVRSFGHFDCDRTRPDKPTSNPRFLWENQPDRGRGAPDRYGKNTVKWLRGRKFGGFILPGRPAIADRPSIYPFQKRTFVSAFG